MALLFIGGEVGLYLVLKILRQDFHYWVPGAPLIGSFFERIIVKVVADFTGCLHFRHPYELGGFGFTISILWAQAFSFVALQFFDEDSKDIMRGFLFVSFSAWLVLNIIFFCTIDLSYLNTFFGSKTAPQYTCEFYLTSNDDYAKFDAVFDNRIQYTKSIHEEVKLWMAANIDQWRRDQPDWFNIHKIPDDFLSKEVFESVGGAKRRRSSVSLREIVGLAPESREELLSEGLTHSPVAVMGEALLRGRSDVARVTKDAWIAVAEKLYEMRTNDYNSNVIHVEEIFEENEALFAPLLDRCPSFVTILSCSYARAVEEMRVEEL